MNAITPTTPAAMQAQAHSDNQLIALWLHGKSAHSQRAYMADVEKFMAHLDKPLQTVTLGDLQSFADSLTGKDNSRKRIISSVKSLFTFGQKLGYLQFNVAAALKAPKPKNTLAERILTESEVLTMIALTTKDRDKVLLRLLYASAGRVSEICGLCWRDVQPSGDSGQVTLFGKGGDTRAVKLSKETWKSLQSIRNGASNDSPVFASQMGGAMVASRVWQIVREAAQRAGIDGNVSPHWFRHSHASHALDRGASVALVRDTLGHSSLAVTSRYTHAKPDQSSALHLAV
jgi:integrase/recombinase XerD